ncbi:GntR family transcriptional regulator [Allohahella sp. A8]|uniref:GntR family transcriptional regulator n=1 Tax=Allohahella sp. A8 TaxID=3141461 RepID=UPI0026D77C9D
MYSIEPTEPTPQAGQATLGEQAFDLLQTAIIRGDIETGTRVSEADLMTRFALGRAPVREAMQRLQARGLIVRRPHAGAKIISLSAQQLDELYLVREALEGMACRLAATAMTDEELRSLRELLEQHADEIRREGGLEYYQREGDFDFHYRIIAGCKNEQLARQLTGDLYHLLRLYRYRLSTLRGRPERALKEHMRVLDALDERDPDLAELLMRRHISAARNNLLTRLSATTLLQNRSSQP